VSGWQRSTTAPHKIVEPGTLRHFATPEDVSDSLSEVWRTADAMAIIDPRTRMHEARLRGGRLIGVLTME